VRLISRRFAAWISLFSFFPIFLFFIRGVICLCALSYSRRASPPLHQQQSRVDFLFCGWLSPTWIDSPSLLFPPPFFLSLVRSICRIALPPPVAVGASGLCIVFFPKAHPSDPLLPPILLAQDPPPAFNSFSFQPEYRRSQRVHLSVYLALAAIFYHYLDIFCPLPHPLLLPFPSSAVEPFSFFEADLFRPISLFFARDQRNAFG